MKELTNGYIWSNGSMLDDFPVNMNIDTGEEEENGAITRVMEFEGKVYHIVTDFSGEKVYKQDELAKAEGEGEDDTDDSSGNNSTVKQISGHTNQFISDNATEMSSRKLTEEEKKKFPGMTHERAYQIEYEGSYYECNIYTDSRQKQIYKPDDLAILCYVNYTAEPAAYGKGGKVNNEEIIFFPITGNYELFSSIVKKKDGGVIKEEVFEKHTEEETDYEDNYDKDSESKLDDSDEDDLDENDDTDSN